MGIKIEFNPDLALRDIAEFKAKRRKKEECLPEKLEIGQVYNFLKKDQRNYWLHGEVPLLETKGGEILSRPLASVQILEATHFLLKEGDSYGYPQQKESELLTKGNVWTKGKYKVIEIFTDDEVHFEGLDRTGSKKF